MWPVTRPQELPHMPEESWRILIQDLAKGTSNPFSDILRTILAQKSEVTICEKLRVARSSPGLPTAGAQLWSLPQGPFLSEPTQCPCSQLFLPGPLVSNYLTKTREKVCMSMGCPHTESSILKFRKGEPKRGSTVPRACLLQQHCAAGPHGLCEPKIHPEIQAHEFRIESTLLML